MTNKPKYNWQIDYVFGLEEQGDVINAHTHGMENYGHLDFQIVIPFRLEHIYSLLNAMGERVRKGEVFKSGDVVSRLYQNVNIRLESFKESGRDVLRLIIPDQSGKFPEEEGCEYPYTLQTETLF